MENKIDSSKIGLCVMAYARPDYLRTVLQSLFDNNWGGAGFKMVMLDFHSKEMRDKNLAVIQSFPEIDLVLAAEENLGIGKAKNQALKIMYDRGLEHFFTLEDDVYMKKPDTCIWYIQSAQYYGIEHLNFAHHGPANVGFKGMVERNGRGVCVYPHCVGAFTYVTKHVLETIGYIDENFINAMDHPEYTYRIALAGLTTDFWYFADAPLSDKYLQEIPNSIENSTIRPRSDWESNLFKAKQYWQKKYNGQWLPEFPREFWSRHKKQ